MKNGQLKGIILLTGLTLFGLMGLQLHWVSRTMSASQQQFRQTAMHSLQQVAYGLSPEIASKTIIPVEELSSNYYSVELQGPVDSSLLAGRLKKVFGKKTFSQMHYSVFSKDGSRMLFGNKIEGTSAHIAKGAGFKLYVYFPGQPGMMFGNVWIWGATMLLLVVMTFIFAYAIFLIYKQRKLALLQKEFIKNITHEFKTPLSSIGLSADTLLKHPLLIKAPDVQKIISIIAKESSRLDHEVDRILAISSLEKTDMNLIIEEIELNEFIKEFAAVQFPAQLHRITLDLNASVSFIKADKMGLSHLLSNLLDNALKYSGQTSMVCIGTMANNINGLQVFVEDHGPGIGKDFYSKIFQPFYRIPSGDLHQVRGFGIGLHYVRQISLRHGWSVDLESELGCGTRFIIGLGASLTSKNSFKKIHSHVSSQAGYSLR